MPRIFISYRRADSRLVTNRIYDRLVDAFGKKNVFKDVDNIPPGRDFRGVLREATARCRVMFVIIGPNWLNVTDPNGNHRLDDPNDFVRLEVETGLQRDNILVIPILVEGALPPTPAQLPEALSALAFRSAFVIHDDPLFHYDMDKLILALPMKPLPKWHFPIWLAAIVAFLLIALSVMTLQPRLNQQTVTQTVISPSAVDTPSVTLQPTSTLNGLQGSMMRDREATQQAEIIQTLTPDALFRVGINSPSIDVKVYVDHGISIFHPPDEIWAYAQFDRALPAGGTKVGYLVFVRVGGIYAFGYVLGDEVNLYPPSNNPSAVLPLVTLTPTPRS